MPTDIRFLPAILAQLAAAGDERFQVAMLTIAQRIEAEMKVKAGEGGAHSYGTPTTASPGGGPAVISGDLRRSITHQKVAEGYRIGPDSTPHGRYQSRGARPGRRGGKSRGSTSGQIGEWLENGGRYGVAYPFVQPALDAVKNDIEAMVAADFRAPL